jgi:hypothetical protein
MMALFNQGIKNLSWFEMGSHQCFLPIVTHEIGVAGS